MDCLFCGRIQEVKSCEMCEKRLCSNCMFAEPINDPSLNDYEAYPHDSVCMPIKCDCGHIAFLRDAIFGPMDGIQCSIREIFHVRNRQDAINKWNDFSYPKESYWICGVKNCLRISCPKKECVKSLLEHRHNHSMIELVLVGKANRIFYLPKDLYGMIRQKLIDEDLDDKNGCYDY